MDFNFYTGKKIFLTGHTGFKGSWLLCWLNSLGAIVRGYSLEAQIANSLFNTIEGKIDFENVIADIRDKQRLQQEIQDFQPDIIFHLAAQALVRKSYQIPSETFEVNAIGTANVLEAVNQLQKKCTVIVITTDKVYENKEINYHYKEEDLLGGYDPYSASKAATEIVVSSFRNSFFNRSTYQQHQKAIVSARAGNVIGGGDFSDDRIVPDIVRALQNNKAIEVRNPNAVRPWQHVLEPLNGYLTLGKMAYKNYEQVADAYNFGPLIDDHLPVKDLVKTAIQCWGNGEWKDTSSPSQLHEAGLLMLDINKAKTELNWLPKLNSKQAIEWTINWYKESGNKLEFTLQQIKDYASL
ncbi:MAG: CDP-glucose 4,6-dehydratase [Chitinophagaceae bacterium]